MRKGLFFSSLFIAAASAAALILYITAPVSRAFTGYVFRGSDVASGQPAPAANANVRLTADMEDKSSDKLFQRATQTNDRGWFTFPDLPEGRFQIEVTTPDGLTATVKNLTRGMNNLTITVGPAKK